MAVVCLSLMAGTAAAAKNFEIQNTFVLDGKPLQIISGRC